jgi:hypothetical protein
MSSLSPERRAQLHKLKASAQRDAERAALDKKIDEAVARLLRRLASPPLQRRGGCG